MKGALLTFTLSSVPAALASFFFAASPLSSSILVKGVLRAMRVLYKLAAGFVLVLWGSEPVVDLVFTMVGVVFFGLFIIMDFEECIIS